MMDWTYHYGSRARLYLNVTNRCTNRCSFCVRNSSAGLGDGALRGGPEPTREDLCAAIDARGGPTARRYFELCRPTLPPHTPARIWEATLDFIRIPADRFSSVQASVVDRALSPDEIIARGRLARSLGAQHFRVRG